MSFRNEVGMLAVSLVLAGGGCADQVPGDLDTANKAYKSCNSDGSCASPNCDDINQPNQGPGSDFSMAIPSNTSLRYKLTGFYLGSDSKWKVRGFLVNQSTMFHTTADGTVSYAVIGGAQLPVVSMNTVQTGFVLTYCSVNSTPCPAGSEKVHDSSSTNGDQIVIQVPGSIPVTRDSVSYTLTFTSKPQTLDLTVPNSPEVVGYSFTYQAKGVPVAPLCVGKGGVAQRTMFYQSAYWNPQTFVKTTDKSSVTVSCELGAIAACMSWGYKPWEATQANGVAQTKDVWHATCVNAKTANYCGDGVAWTSFGTEITVSDPLSPQVMSDDVKYIEALWTPTGAACVNPAYRRHTNLPWQPSSCATPMPDCSTFKASDYFTTGVPSTPSP